MIMSVFHRIYIWLCRFPHRRGYGVHSPFAFNFITSVVYERGVYYAYEHLETKYGLHANGFFRLLQPETAYKRRMGRLLFRISNYVHPDFILLGGDVSDWERGYLTAGSRRAELHDLSNQETRRLEPGGEKTFLAYFADTESADTNWRTVSALATETSVILIAGIHVSKAAASYWAKFQNEEAVGITFDLYDYGVAFLDRTRYKQHYIVNF